MLYYINIEEMRRTKMTDQKRANELAKIINDTSKGLSAEEIFRSGVSIKTKVSKSSWYNSHEGSGHEQSMYETYVLKSVHNEAKELQAIRRANQGNFEFDFQTSSYTHVVYRMADHDNYEHSALDLELVLNSAEQEAKESQELAEYESKNEELKKIVEEQEAKDKAEQEANNKIVIEDFSKTVGKTVLFTKQGFGKVIEVAFHHSSVNDSVVGTARVEFENGQTKAYDRQAIEVAIKKAEMEQD